MRGFFQLDKFQNWSDLPEGSRRRSVEEEEATKLNEGVGGCEVLVVSLDWDDVLKIMLCGGELVVVDEAVWVGGVLVLLYGCWRAVLASVDVPLLLNFPGETLRSLRRLPPLSLDAPLVMEFRQLRIW